MVETLWGCALLALALSMDTFAAGLALGTQQIKIPFCSALALGLTCSLSLWAAVWLGDAAGGWMSVRTASLLGGGVLVVMGTVRLCDGLLKNALEKMLASGKTAGCSALKICGFFCRCVSIPPVRILTARSQFLFPRRSVWRQR